MQFLIEVRICYAVWYKNGENNESAELHPHLLLSFHISLPQSVDYLGLP
uniref:Uncharacterized protein n=1 Tax=Anguilla anguilla TaxID=7936 RepID=A0A0E9X240_ANGAN